METIRKTLIFLLVPALFVSCYDSFIEEKIEQPISEQELIYCKGECLLFDFGLDGSGLAVVTNLSKQDGEIWYGLCFTNFNDSMSLDALDFSRLKFFGRKIQTTLNQAGYFEALDVEFVSEGYFHQNEEVITIIGDLNLKEILPIGSEGATANFSGILNSWKSGQEKRLLPPDHYSKHVTKLKDFRPEEYLPVSNYLY